MTAKALDARAIRDALSALGHDPPPPVSVMAVTVSTNDDARKAAGEGAPHGAAFLADAQSRGRGRGTHSWHSPPGENLYLSIVLRPGVPAHDLAPLALVAGVAVARVVDPRLPDGSVRARIKWPNDVLVGAKKLAGILVEAQLRGPNVASVVVGVGVNVATTEFPEELRARATSLAVLGAGDLSRERLAAELVAELLRACATYERDRLAPFHEALLEKDALLGAQLEVAGVRGTGAGLDADGLLRVRGDDGVEHLVASGEVTLLSAPRG